MSRQLIHSEKFPPKPHNCEFILFYFFPVDSMRSSLLWFILTKLAIRFAGPAVKVPGLVFCAGQTATGEIKQATVSLCKGDLLLESLADTRMYTTTENCFAEPQGSSRACWIVA